MMELTIEEIQKRKELITEIENGVPPNLLLLARIADFIRDSLIDAPSILVLHIQEARAHAKKVHQAYLNFFRFQPERMERPEENAYLKYLDKFQEDFIFWDSRPSTADLSSLYDKTMEFLEAYT